MKLKIAIGLTVVLTGCATQQINLTTTFNEEEAIALLKEGKNTIKGSALMRQNNGGTVTCAGNNVHLVPGTAYASERMQALYRNTSRGYLPVRTKQTQSPFANNDPNYTKHVRKTVCDAQGYFKFDKLADGDFFVTTTISWRANPYFMEGGALMQKVSVKGAEVKEVTLAP